jgi:vanadium chloroperoxidase
MYDAYAAIVPAAGGPYLTGLLVPLPIPLPGDTTRAAVSAAAYCTLVALYPSQKVFFDTKLSEAGGVLEPGHEFGRLVAQAHLNYRQGDPGAGSAGYIPSLARGKHKEDPDNPGQGFHAPFYGARSRGYAITAKHGLLAPPPLSDPEYVAALQEVRVKGIAPELMGTLPASALPPRSTNETLSGIFWGYDGATGVGTPPRLYNQIVRRVAVERANTEAQNARLFALVNVAMADAGVLAWEQKYIHDLWRPVVGIREHDPSMGMASAANNALSVDCDSSWLPLGAPATNSLNQHLIPQQMAPAFPHTLAVLGRVKNFTPNFPAYPSGHATFGAAALHITRLFYGPGGINNGGVTVGDRSADGLFAGLDFVSDEYNGVNQDNRGAVRPRHARSFPGGLWQMIEENGRSRVHLGVHWVFDAFAVDATGAMDLSRNIGGVPLGLTIAEDIFNSGMVRSIV